MKEQNPTFPPLLKGYELNSGKNVFAYAIKQANAGKLGAGDLVWSQETRKLEFALVLEPDVDLQRCGEMLFTAMVAFGDAAGAICPPEVSIQYQWPSAVLMNGAKIGNANIELSQEIRDNIPNWMVIGLEIRIRPEKFVTDPGQEIDKTTMWDEGCGDLERTELLESVTRHFVSWIHTWTEDGFKPIHDQWWGRVFEEQKMEENFLGANLFGLDESGNALLKEGDNIQSIQLTDALSKLRSSK